MAWQSVDNEDSSMDNEQIIRRAYAVAERVDIKGWVDCFTPDGTFTDMSIGVTYQGPEATGGSVECRAAISSSSSATCAIRPARSLVAHGAMNGLWGSNSAVSELCENRRKP